MTKTNALDLDTLEREDRPGPFSVTLGGREYVLVDATEIDYRELLAGQRAYLAGDPELAIRTVVAEDDRDAFFANAMPAYKLEALFSAYNAHHGLGDAPK